MSRWDDVYSRKENVYGSVGVGLVWQYLHLAPPGPVLDIGCGEGRNGLMAARLGRRTMGLDVSGVAVERANRLALTEALPFRAQVADLTRYEFPLAHFAFVIAAYTLPFVRASEARLQVERMGRALLPGGLLYLSGLTTEDPDYSAHVGPYEQVEPGSFYKPELREYRTFFQPGQLQELAKAAGLTVLEYAEGSFLDEHPAPHYHRQAQVVARA